MGILASKLHSNLDCLLRPAIQPKLSSFDGLSDEEAVIFLETYDFDKGRIILESGIERPIWRVSEDTVIKCLGRREANLRDCEAYTMALVASQTSVPVPRIRKQVFWEDCLYVFMEYIEGDNLIDLWTSLSWWRRFRIAWTLRGYVAQLRRIAVRPIPGPINGSNEPISCRGHWFTEAGDGPFSSYSELASWYASKQRISIALSKELCRIRRIEYDEPNVLPFDDTAPLVVTHGDISFWNVRLGKDGVIWLLDWGYSGVYPKWFEYIAIMAYDDFQATTPKSWFWFAPLIAGWYRSQNRFMEQVALARMYYGFQDPGPEPSRP